MSRKTMLLGTTALIAGLAMLGLALSSPGRAAAGNTQIPCDATATATPNQGVIANLQVVSATPVPTCTPVKLKTHTPTTTPTEAATATQVPVTPAATNTQPAATATRPGGGAGGQEVLPPSTGTGAMAGGSGIELSFLFAGLLLLTLGSGSVLMGVRRRS